MSRLSDKDGVLETKIDRVVQKITGHFDGLDQLIDEKMKTLTVHVNELDQNTDVKFKDLSDRFDKLDEKEVNDIEELSTKISQNLESYDQKLSDLDESVSKLQRDLSSDIMSMQRSIISFSIHPEEKIVRLPSQLDSYLNASISNERMSMSQSQQALKSTPAKKEKKSRWFRKTKDKDIKNNDDAKVDLKKEGQLSPSLYSIDNKVVDIWVDTELGGKVGGDVAFSRDGKVRLQSTMEIQANIKAADKMIIV